MRTHLALLAGTALLLTGCSFSFGGPDAVSVTELEKQLVSLYEPDDPDSEMSAECEGELAAKVDATQDCRIDVGEDSAQVRVVVTKIGDEVVDFEARPFVPAEELAQTIQDTLAGQGNEVDAVDCADELPGELDATVDCTVSTPDGDVEVVSTVTAVEGLLVNFDIDEVS